ncbi:MAG: Hsp20/alpha crystallin family protein [Actinomycetota bacterium]
MLLQNDPFRDLDQLFRAFGRADAPEHRMSMDAYRRGENVWVHIDLPGVSAEAVDISVERNVLTVTAERTYPTEDGDRFYLRERRQGAFRRQVHLGENLDTDNIEADYADGVLTLRIPVAEKAKPRKITVGNRGAAIEADLTESTTA